MLAMLQDRLERDRETELKTACEQQRQIFHLRLDKFVCEISTHILDTARGCPATGVEVTLSQWDANRWHGLNTAVTDENGRISDLQQTRCTLKRVFTGCNS